MTVEDVKAMIPSARPYGGGYRGPCPSCGGGSRSTKFGFVEREGKILFHCFSGCSTETICRSMNIDLRDLFVDTGLTVGQRRAIPPRTRRFDWRKMSHDMEFASESHWLRGEAIFKAARLMNVSAMTGKDMDAAWKCLTVGFYALLISENLGITAFKIRQNGLKDEARRYRGRRVEA